MQLLGCESIHKSILREELAECASCWSQLKGTDVVTLQLSDDGDACSDDETSLRDIIAESVICIIILEYVFSVNVWIK